MNERTKYIDTRFGGNAADSLLQNEIDALDVEVKAEEERAKKEEKRLDEKIDAETERAISEEHRIEGRLDEEIERAESEEKRIEDKLDDEIERSTAEDERLDQKIEDETARAQEAERALDEKIDTETERAEAAEGTLDRKIDKEIEDRIADVDAEEASRIAADEALDQKIDQEIQDRIADVDAEEAARIAAVAAEAQAREEADAEEAQAREEADTEEAAARVLGDESLQDQIDTIEARSDVVDVVSCYDRDDYEEPKPETDLVHYDTSTLSDNDVVKVLIDETHDNAVTYYRWVITSARGEPTEGEWVFIGSVEAYYTKAETDAIVEELQGQIDKDIEVVEYQTTTPLTDEQVAKARVGKLAIYSPNSKVLMVKSGDGTTNISFRSTNISSTGEHGTYLGAIDVFTDNFCYLNKNTKMLHNLNTNNRSMLSDNITAVFNGDVIPATEGQSGNRIVRALNLRKTQNMMAPVYDSTATYSEGDYVIYQNDFYKCVSAITVAEAWNSAHWAKSSLSEMLDDIHTASELEILRLFREECTITSNITNGSASGDSTVWTEETASVTIAANSGYNLPETITVVGASYTYDSTTGVVALSDATGNVIITATCPIPIDMPAKGDIIKLDNGTARYRVLKTHGNVAEVMALDDVANSKFNSSSVTTTFSDGSTGQKYENSTLDTYMNSTFYNSLSANIKAAIVQKAITQSIYQFGSSEISGYDFAINRIDSTTRWHKRKGQVSVGNRYCYALDLDDVAEYLGAGSGNTVSGADLNDMFFERTTAISKYVWLDSAYSAYSGFAFRVLGNFGCVGDDSCNGSYVARPAFQVDLTNLAWEKEVSVPTKGDIITIDGGTARYRVLDVSGSETLLLAMDDYTSSVYNSYNITKTFDGGKTGQKYEGSTLDTLLNETYYNSLSSNVKSAIVDQTRIQRMYSYQNPDDPSYDYHQQYDFDASDMRGLPIDDQTTVGSRHVFALDVKDIFDYLEKDTMTSAELNEMFFEQTTAVSKYVWLSSANSISYYYAFRVLGDYGCVNSDRYSNSNVVRPAFQVDLTNLAWAKESNVDPVLANNSWETIAQVCNSGQAADYWSLGDTKTDIGTDGVTRTFRICDMYNAYTGKVVFEQVELENTDYRWNPSSNVDGENCYNNYSISEMRTTHLPAILAKYSNSLQSVITNTKYKVATNGKNGTLLELEDKLFLPAEREIFSSRSYSRTEEWNALTRFQLYAANDTSTFRKKYKPGATSAYYWWLRSPYSGDTGSVCGVSGNGNAGNYSVGYSGGVSPFFAF